MFRSLALLAAFALTPLHAQTNPAADARYEAALAEALRLLAADDDEAALTKFREAQAARPSDTIRAEVARLDTHRSRRTAGERTAQAINGVLQAGDVEQASKLARESLAAEWSEPVAAVKRQIDAVLLQRLQPAQFRLRMMAEADDARSKNSLRLAYAAYESAFNAGAEGPEARTAWDTTRNQIHQRDALVRRADEARRDPYRLEEALADLRAAQQIWDGPAVREKVRRVEFALGLRRDRLAVALFEVEGDVGVPNAARVMADQLAAHFATGYDVVSRADTDAAYAKLGLTGGESEPIHSRQAREGLARMLRARYLLVGHIVPDGGATIHARMIDLRTGLVAQTARVTSTPQDFAGSSGWVAYYLNMGDEAKVAYERDEATRTTVLGPAALGAIPPAPEVPRDLSPGRLPPAIVASYRNPPADGGIRWDQFVNVAQAPAGSSVVVHAAAPQLRERALAVAVELGDNLFARGQFREALRLYGFAQSLAPGQRELRQRVARCRPLAPNAGQSRPRLAVASFAEVAPPDRVPPGTGAWLADNVPPYYSGRFDVIDRGEVFWWMARLGLTQRDLIADPAARLCLTRAMGATHLMLGGVRANPNNVEAVAFLIDPETDSRVGAGDARAGDSWSLKLVVPELAAETGQAEAERRESARRAAEYEGLIAQGRAKFEAREFATAVALFEKAGTVRPGSVEAQEWGRRALRGHSEILSQFAARAAEAREQAARHDELARQAEAARLDAERRAGALQEADRQRIAREQEAAYQATLAQARAEAKARRFERSEAAFEAALRVRADDAVARELAQARLQLAEERRRNDAVAQQQARDREAEAARQAVAAEQQRAAQQAAEREQRRANKDSAEARRLIDEAAKATAKGQHDRAVSLLQSAQRQAPSDAAQAALNQALAQLAAVQAGQKSAAEKAALQAALNEEAAQRDRAEAKLKETRQKYQEAMRRALEAEKANMLEEARDAYAEAVAVLPSDEGRGARRRVEDRIAQREAARKADQDAKAQGDVQARQRQAQFDAALAEGRQLAGQNKWGQARQAFARAVALKPDAADAQAELAKAEGNFARVGSPPKGEPKKGKDDPQPKKGKGKDKD